MLNNQGGVALFRGDYQQTVELCRQGLAFAQPISVHAARASWFFTGEAFYHQGLLAESKSSYEQSLILSEKVGNLRHNGRTLIRLGQVACAQGDLAQANTLFKKGLMIVTESNDLVGSSMALIGLARMAAHP